MEEAFSRDPNQPDNRRASLVRDLARDIKDQLEALARSTPPEPSPNLTAEAALRCADLANLAACNLDVLPTPEAVRVGTGVRLASETVQAIQLLSESETNNSPETHPAALRDIRGSGWRVELAVRQTEEFLEAATES